MNTADILVYDVLECLSEEEIISITNLIYMILGLGSEDVDRLRFSKKEVLINLLTNKLHLLIELLNKDAYNDSSTKDIAQIKQEFE